MDKQRQREMKKRIIVAGIGPGSAGDVTPAVLEAVRQADVIIGYKYYFQFIEPYVQAGTECVDTGMLKEKERARQAFEQAEQGKTVCVISSGDAGIYGMAPLIWEMKRERGSDVEIEVLPGISAFQKAASLLGAPIGHDLCIISLSDLMTPWETIEKRLRMAAEADFAIVLYNPSSRKRADYLRRACDILLETLPQEQICGTVRNIGREGEETRICTLSELRGLQADMFTTVFVGNRSTKRIGDRMVTPRGYARER